MEVEATVAIDMTIAEAVMDTVIVVVAVVEAGHTLGEETDTREAIGDISNSAHQAIEYQFCVVITKRGTSCARRSCNKVLFLTTIQVIRSNVLPCID